MTTAHLRDDIKRDEGLRLAAYQDSVGIWTVGYGAAHVPPDTVWTQAQAEARLDADIQLAVDQLDQNLPWWRTLDDDRQDVLVNMCFNLGIGGLLGFKNTLGMIRGGDYAGAANGMLNSLWAKQVGARASRLAAKMRGAPVPAKPIPVIGPAPIALASAPLIVTVAVHYPWSWPILLAIAGASAMTTVIYAFILSERHKGHKIMPVSPEFQADLDAIAKAVTDIAAHEAGEGSATALQAQLTQAQADLKTAQDAAAAAEQDKADTLAALNAQVASLESQVAALTPAS